MIQAVALAFQLDQVRVMQEAIQDGGGAGDVAEEFAPVFEWTIARHDGRARFVATQDDLEQAFTGAFWQLLHTHVINDEQIGLEILRQHFVAIAEQLVVEEVADQIEDGAVQDQEARFDGVVAERLGQKTFSHAGRTQEQNVATVSDELTRRQLEDRLFGDRCVEAPIELIERLDPRRILTRVSCYLGWGRCHGTARRACRRRS
jgi:hypothetical protein